MLIEMELTMKLIENTVIPFCLTIFFDIGYVTELNKLC